MRGTGARPVALGYVVGAGKRARARQTRAVENQAREEGYALAGVLVDERDAITISELVQALKLHEAAAVIVPAQSRMAGVLVNERDLEPLGVRCLVLTAPCTTPSSTKTTTRTKASPRGRGAPTSNGTP